MSVLMMLQGGPLDGEEQVVLNVPRTPGATMFFNIPSFQTFGLVPSGEFGDNTFGSGVFGGSDDDFVVALIGLGLQATYAMLAQGPGPDDGDVWDTSWVFGFAGDVFTPPPPDVDIPVIPSGGVVFMNAETGMEIDADDPSSGVWMEADASMEVDATVAPPDQSVGVIPDPDDDSDDS